MSRLFRTFVIRAAALATGSLLLASGAVAGTPLPTIPMPSDESVKCIQPADEMRRNHMNYILHERDETMYEGIREEPASLANCIDCHVEPNEKGEIAGIDTDQHFCSGCHEYASVQIDCFQCHADRPQEFIDRGDAHSKGTASLMHQLHKTLATAEASDDQASVGENNQ